MKFYYPFFLFQLLALPTYCQPTYDNFNLFPIKPESGKTLKIEYTPIAPFLMVGVRAFVLLNKPLEHWARAIEVPMQRVNDKLFATVTPSLDDVSLLIVFLDSLGNTIDNNNDYGYWTPLFQNGESIPGSMASIANMYCGMAQATEYKIKQARALAQSLYLQDFTRKPELKRFYWRHYISSIRYEDEPSLWMNEMDQYSALNDLTDWELEDISRRFNAIKDTASAKRFYELIFKRHPLGEWSLQRSSMEYQNKYAESKKSSERIAISAAHRAKFATWPMTEDKRRYLETVTIVYFLKGIDDYISQGKFEEWKGLADSNALRPYAKNYAFFFAAQRLNRKKIFPKQAGELAKEATDWREQSLDSPRIYSDWPYLSDREVRHIREKELSEWLEVYANSLRLQERNVEANTIFEKAKRYATHQSATLPNQQSKEIISATLQNVNFYDFNNKLVDIKKYKGKTIVLDFWASWCAPCIAGFKKMFELKKMFDEENVFFFS